MKIYEYGDQSGVHRITYREIIQQYFPYWAKCMRKAGKADEIYYDRCVEDFCIIHWAYKVSDE